MGGGFAGDALRDASQEVPSSRAVDPWTDDFSNLYWLLASPDTLARCAAMTARTGSG